MKGYIGPSQMLRQVLPSFTADPCFHGRRVAVRRCSRTLMTDVRGCCRSGLITHVD